MSKAFCKGLQKALTDLLERHRLESELHPLLLQLLAEDEQPFQFDGADLTEGSSEWMKLLSVRPVITFSIHGDPALLSQKLGVSAKSDANDPGSPLRKNMKKLLKCRILELEGLPKQPWNGRVYRLILPQALGVVVPPERDAQQARLPTAQEPTVVPGGVSALSQPRPLLSMLVASSQVEPEVADHDSGPGVEQLGEKFHCAISLGSALALPSFAANEELPSLRSSAAGIELHPTGKYAPYPEGLSLPVYDILRPRSASTSTITSLPNPPTPATLTPRGSFSVSPESDEVAGTLLPEPDRRIKDLLEQGGLGEWLDVFRREEITWEYLQANVDQSAMFHFLREILPSRVRPKSLAHLHRAIAQALKQEAPRASTELTVKMGVSAGGSGPYDKIRSLLEACGLGECLRQFQEQEITWECIRADVDQQNLYSFLRQFLPPALAPPKSLARLHHGFIREVASEEASATKSKAAVPSGIADDDGRGEPSGTAAVQSSSSSEVESQQQESAAATGSSSKATTLVRAAPVTSATTATTRTVTTSAAGTLPPGTCCRCGSTKGHTARDCFSKKILAGFPLQGFAISEAERQRRQAAKGKINPYRKKTYYTSTYRRY